MSFVHPFHINTVQLLLIIIKIHLCEENFSTALEYFSKVYKILNFTSISLHPMQVIIYSLLSHYYFDLQLYEESIDQARQALDSSIKVYGTLSEVTAQSYRDLGQSLLYEGHCNEAYQNLSLGSQIYQNLKKTNSVHNAEICFFQSLILIKQEKYIDALQLYLSSLQTYEQLP